MSGISICGDLWFAFYFIWLVWAFQSKKTLQHAGFAEQLPYRLLPILALFLVFSPNLPIAWLHSRILPWIPALGWTGVAVTLAGFVIAIWARFCLAGNWSSSPAVKVEHQLIRTGPYRWLRHPIYTGLIVAMAGSALALNQWRGPVAVFLLWAAFTVKSRREERYMRQVFGQQYDEYIRSTGALLPRLHF